MLKADLAVLEGIPTPALVVDGSALRSNIAKMAARVSGTGVRLRPHSKTHKSDHIARLQIEAGAAGVACATLLEVEALSAAGIDGLLLTAPAMGQGVFERLAARQRSRPFAAVVDHIDQVRAIEAALGVTAEPMSILVDVDVGQARTGVTSPAMAVELARAIAASRSLSFAGIQGYAGHAQHVADVDDRRRAAREAARILAACVEATAEAGLRPAIVTGSGTGAHRFDLSGPYTELQPGSYVFMDADYGQVREDGGEGLGFEPSLFVLATVVSVNRPGQVTVDAGTKSLAVNGPPPSVFVGAPEGTRYAFSGDEHGALSLPPGRTLSLGARVLIGATHCDPTVNLHPWYHVVSDGSIETWPIVGRYGWRAGT